MNNLAKNKIFSFNNNLIGMNSENGIIYTHNLNCYNNLWRALMSKSIPFKKLAMYSLTTATIAVVSQGAFAHTRFETSIQLEGVKTHNYVNIGHGCPPADKRNPTMGTSVIFPNAATYVPVIVKNDGTGKKLATDSPLELFSPLAGLGVMIRQGGPWDNAQYKADSVGNLDGFWAGGKAYDQTISTPINVAFASTAVTIPVASCARSVTFVAQIADYCSIGATSSLASDEEVLYWSAIPDYVGRPYGSPTAKPAVTGAHPAPAVPAGSAYSKYDGYQDAAHTVTGDGWSSPATYTVVRNLVTNPLPAGCATNTFSSSNPGAIPLALNTPYVKYDSGYTKGFDIYVYPSAAQINAESPVWSGTQQNGTPIWK